MWPLVVMFTLVAAIGAVVVSQTSAVPAIEQARGEESVRGVALYRALVLQAVQDRPGFVGSLADSELRLPPWYLRDQAWSNWVSADGTVTVFAKLAQPRTLLADLADIADHSILVGEVRQGDSGAATLYSPLFGDTGIPVTGVPAGAVAWLARVK
jgi:hypothetical protein